jgi:hypothetical protein
MEVLNRRMRHSRADRVVYVGRPSPWGNPFEIGKHGTREEVIEKYRAWLGARPELVERLRALEPHALECWCAPLACHASVLVEALNQ